MKEAKTLVVVECQGTDLEVGQQYGEACRDNIRKALEISLGRITQLTQASREEIIGNTNKFLSKTQEFDPNLLDFLKGEAAGANISFAEAFYLRCATELNFYFREISGCTSFAATGTATRNGKTMLGQNIDWLHGFPMELLKIKYADGLEQLALGFGGTSEWIMNSYGLGMCANVTLANCENYRFNLPVGCYLPKAMRQKTIGEALGIFCQAARSMFYYHLGSAEGEIIGIESDFDGFNVLQPEKDILVHTNHYLTERYQQGDWAYLLFPDTYVRINRIKSFMEGHYGNITPELMMGILADHHNYPYSICRHDKEDVPRESRIETIVSFIMVPEDRKMYIACGNPCQYEYVEYKL